MNTREQRLDRLCEKLSRDPRVSELQLRVTDRAGTLDHGWAAPDSRTTHAIASSTKTFAAVLVLRRVAAGDLTLEQPLASILPRDDLVGLNRFGGIDRADEITVRDALAHTSGISNYYAAKALDPASDIEAVTAADPGWSYHDALELARGMTAPFAPHSGRAEYSFTNYQLVGRLIEAIYGCPLAAALDCELLAPLALSDTALLTPETVALIGTSPAVNAVPASTLDNLNVTSAPAFAPGEKLPTGAAEFIAVISTTDVDQRDVERTGLADAGAYEFGEPTPELAATGLEPATAGWLVGFAALLLGSGAAVAFGGRCRSRTAARTLARP